MTEVLRDSRGPIAYLSDPTLNYLKQRGFTIQRPPMLLQFDTSDGGRFKKFFPAVVLPPFKAGDRVRHSSGVVGVYVEGDGQQYAIVSTGDGQRDRFHLCELEMDEGDLPADNFNQLSLNL